MNIKSISKSIVILAILLHQLTACSSYVLKNKFSHPDQLQDKSETSGHIGFNLAYSPTDQYFVSSIDSQSEAWTKGLRVGYSIVGWNRQLISDAILADSLRREYHPATADIAQLMTCHYLTRGKPGSSVELFFVNDQENTKGVRISYVGEPFETTPKYIGVIAKDSRKKQEFISLSDNLAYIRLDQFTPSSFRYFNKYVINHFNSFSGIIIDLRENTGGNDHIAVKTANHFVTKTRHYEKQYIEEVADTQNIEMLESFPGNPQFTGRVVIITGPLTQGAAEGFVKLLQNEDMIDVLGSWNTTGNFSIKPDILIPPTKDLIIQMEHGTDVLLMEAAGHLKTGQRAYL